MRCCKIPKGYSFKSSHISDYANIVKITSSQHYWRLAKHRVSEHKMFGNDRMEIASTDVMSIWRFDIEKSMRRTHRYFVTFGSRIHVEISTLNRYHDFHVDSPFKIDKILTKFPRGISASYRWRIKEDVSIGSLH